MTVQHAHKEGFQGPINGDPAQNINARLRIVSHPALRLGFLDAMHGKPFDHDNIVSRIMKETPRSSLERTGWSGANLFTDSERIERAQYRYEEGRLLVIKYGLRCKSWNHPDYPPKALREFALNRPDREPL